MRIAAVLFCLFSSMMLASAAESRPNVVLITMDTVRADRMGFLGSTAKLTPNLDALAHTSLRFTHAYAQAPLTTVSHASLFTGTYPRTHGVVDFAKPLPKDLPALAPLLKTRGYTTAAFVGSMILDPKELAPGFDRGFDVYDAGYRLRRVGLEPRFGTLERRAFDVVDRASRWLQQPKQAPFFLWVHLFDAHEPYLPPSPFDQRGSSKYDGEVAYVDAAIGRLLDVLRKQGAFANALIVVASDHGEALGDHGENSHGVFLYDETIRVPLLVKLPGITRGSEVREMVQLIDVTPTILQVVGASTPKTMDGTSLLPNNRHATDIAYSETDYPRRAFGWAPLAALRRGKYLYVQAPQRELYDLVSDPRAERNLAPSMKGVADVLAAQVAPYRVQTAEGAKSSLTDEQVRKLAALGYLGSSTSNAQRAAGAVDPKTKIAVANRLHEAMIAVEDGRYADARPLLEKVVKDDPQIYTSQFQLGLAYAKDKKLTEAIPHLKAAVVIQPDSPLAQYELGLVLFSSGDLAGSATAFEAAANLMPQWADAQYSLGSVYARTDRIKDALDRLQSALELDPEHFRANLLTGRILALQGRPDVGAPLLEKAVELQEDSAEAHLFLADAYRKLGRLKEAQAHEQRAKALTPGR